MYLVNVNFIFLCKLNVINTLKKDTVVKIFLSIVTPKNHFFTVCKRIFIICQAVVITKFFKAHSP